MSSSNSAHDSGHDVPQVHSCSHPKCHSGASTTHGDHAHCCTFVEITLRLGTDPATLAGACHRHDCRFADMFECPASSLGWVPAPREPSD